MLVTSVRTSHVYNFQDVWRRKSARPTTSKEKLATPLPKTCYAYPHEDEAIPKTELKH